MLRSLRLLLLTVLVSLSYPLLRCDAQKTAAQYDGGEPPLQVDVRLQGMSQPSLKPTPAASATPSPTPSPSPTPTPTPTPEPTPFSLYWVSDAQVYAYRYPKVYNKIFTYMANACEEQNAIGVLMTGDLVDNRTEQRHWEQGYHEQERCCPQEEQPDPEAEQAGLISLKISPSELSGRRFFIAFLLSFHACL